MGPPPERLAPSCAALHRLPGRVQNVEAGAGRRSPGTSAAIVARAIGGSWQPDGSLRDAVESVAGCMQAASGQSYFSVCCLAVASPMALTAVAAGISELPSALCACPREHRGMEQSPCQGRRKRQGLFSLERSRIRGGMLVVYKIMGSVNEVTCYSPSPRILEAGATR